MLHKIFGFIVILILNLFIFGMVAGFGGSHYLFTLSLSLFLASFTTLWWLLIKKPKLILWSQVLAFTSTHASVQVLMTLVWVQSYIALKMADPNSGPPIGAAFGSITITVGACLSLICLGLSIALAYAASHRKLKAPQSNR